MHHATDFTIKQNMGGYHAEKRAMRIAAVFWFFMLIGLPAGLVLHRFLFY